MVNLEKLKSLIKENGVKQVAICRLLNKNAAFMNDLWNGKTSMKPDEVNIVAEYLHTTPEYLTDQTEEKGIKKETASNDDLINALVAKIMSLPDEDKEKALSYVDYLSNQAK